MSVDYNLRYVCGCYISTACTWWHTHTLLTAVCPRLPWWAGTRKVKPVWILLKQEPVTGSGISWAICRSAPCSRQITMPAPHHRPDALPATQPNVKAPKARAYMAMWMLIPEECVINLCSLLLYINSIDNIIKENCILCNPPALIAVSKGVVIKT